MFAYCRNNPVCRRDVSGYCDEKVLDDGTVEVNPDDKELGAGGGTGSGSGTPSSIQVVAGASGQNGFGAPQMDAPAFPDDPNDFSPNGLVQHVCIEPGTGDNGGIIKWEIPGTKKAVFEWDEDYKNGPHYHAMLPEWGNKHSGDHLSPGTLIDEPWRSKYF